MISRFKRNVSFIKDSVEIIAVVIGGIWALFSFGLKDTPSLKRLSIITPELTVNWVNNKMHLSFFVTVKNNGKSSFEVIEPVTIKVWLIPIKILTEKTYFDWEKYMNDVHWNTSIIDTFFKGNYAPDESVKISHDFFITDSEDNSSKYTVLVYAYVSYKSTRFFVFSSTENDHAYDVKIRYAEPDSLKTISTNIPVKR